MIKKNTEIYADQPTRNYIYKKSISNTIFFTHELIHHINNVESIHTAMQENHYIYEDRNIPYDNLRNLSLQYEERQLHQSSH
jgi:hypothetical protein